MCGIFAAFGRGASNHEINRHAAGLIKHRGPDYTGEYISPDGLMHMIHHRLAIVHPKSGSQPILAYSRSDIKSVAEIEVMVATGALAVNGEIYNYRELNAALNLGLNLETAHSDCDVLIPILRRYKGFSFSDITINGMFGLVYYEKGTCIIARDYMGIIPLYYARSIDSQTIYISSEIKALACLADVEHIKIVRPNSYCSIIFDNGPTCVWHNFHRSVGTFISPTIQSTYDNLAAAVKSHIATEVPMAVLLSGGLDSSIIASLATKFVGRLHTYSVGLADSPDLKAARIMANYLDSIHHEVIFTIEEALEFLPEAVRLLETYDITTIRAGLPMLLMMKQISKDGFKVVLSGEGSDEEWAGYVYNAKAPNPLELYEESVRKMDDLHWYDCRRANMAGAVYGVEVRVPFLDRSVVDYVMSVDPKIKMHSTIRMIDDKTGDIHKSTIEKRHLREAFEHILPASIAWRGKEQFSDGVGYSWINTLKKMAEEKYKTVDDEKYEDNTPLTKEGLWYRSIFEKHFGSKATFCCPNQKSIACSSPKALEWDELWKSKHDPSGRI